MSNHTEPEACHLCSKKRTLRQSHVWPQFAYKRYVSVPSKSGRFVDVFTMTVQNRQYRRPWLCDDCEQTLSRSERPIANLCDRIETDPDADQEYDEHMLRFATSVSWRTLKLYYEEKPNAAIEKMWVAAKRWKQYICGSRTGIAPFTQHTYVVNDNPQGFDKMIGGVAVPEQSLVFSQIGPLLVIGLMNPQHLSAREKAIWRPAQITSPTDTIRPLRTWIAGRGDLGNQNITLPFAGLLAGHQSHLVAKAAAHYNATQSRE
jgi:hypothetical protein